MNIGNQILLQCCFRSELGMCGCLSNTTEHFHFSLKYLCPELINANFETATEFLYYLAFTDHLNGILYQYVNCI